MKVLIREEIAPAGVELLRSRFEVDVDSESDLAEIIGAYDGIVIRSATKLTADLIERGERLRVIGRASITADADILSGFDVNGKLPRTVTIITIESVYFHCSKALVRSKLWDPATWPERTSLPTAGEILTEITNGDFDGVAYDCELPTRLATTLY